MKAAISTAVATVVATPLPAAVPYTVQLDPARCVPLAASDIGGLGPGWSELAPFVQRCPVRGPDGRLALTVDTVRVDLATRQGFFAAHPGIYLPFPEIRDAHGVTIGVLPDGFPVDPPSKLRVRFTDWRGGLPRTVELYEAGESAFPPHALAPLRFDEAAGVYR